MPEAQSNYESQVMVDMNGGVDYDNPACKVARERWSHIANMWTRNGRKESRPGLAVFGGNLPLNGAPMEFPQFKELDGTLHLLCLTTRDAYQFDASTQTWKFITERYITGTASCAGGTAVTGSGTSWSTGWPSNVCQIKFNTQDPNGTGTPDTWYTISSVGGVTSLTLTANGPSTGGAVNYVIRVCFSGDESDIFRSTVCTDPNKNRIYLVNCLNPIKYWAGSAYLVELTGTGVPDTCKDLLWMENRLVLYNTTESGNARPQRVRRSVKGDPDDFNSAGSGFNDLVEDEYPIKCVKKLGGAIAIYKTGSVLLQYYTGEASVYQFEYVLDGGIYAMRGVENLGDGHFIVTEDDVELFYGQRNTDSISSGIWTKLFGEDSTLSTEYRDRLMCMYLDRINKVFLFAPLGSPYNNHAFIFDRNTQEWDRFAFRKDFTAAGFYVPTSGMKWTDLVGAWNAQTWSWADRPVIGATTLLLGDKGGNVYKFDLIQTQDAGASISTALRGPEFIYPGKKIRYGLFKFQASGTAGDLVELYYSRDNGTTWVLLKSFTITAKPSTHKVFINKTLERLMLEFRSVGTWSLDWYEGPHIVKELRA